MLAKCRAFMGGFDRSGWWEVESRQWFLNVVPTLGIVKSRGLRVQGRRSVGRTLAGRQSRQRGLGPHAEREEYYGFHTDSMRSTEEHW